MRRICLFWVSLLAAAPLAGEGRQFTTAVYVLPFQAAADARDADVYAGMGVQSLLEHMLVTDGDLEETWAWWRYKKIFPKQEDLERYLTGQTKEPESAADLTPRWLVRGRMVGSKAVSVTVEDRQSAARATRTIALDFPKLVHLRRSFLALLAEAGMRIPADRRKRMLWPEDLPPRALALAGRGNARYAYDWTAVPDFADAQKLAPRSYLLLNSQGWLLRRQKQFAEAGSLFEQALRRNADGFDALDGQLELAAQQNQVAEAQRASMRMAQVRGKPAEDDPAAVIRLCNIFIRYRHFESARAIVEQALEKQVAETARKKLGTALETCYILQADAVSENDDAAAIPIYELALKRARELRDRAGEATALQRIGESYSGLKQYGEAIRRHEDELPIRRELKDQTQEILCLEEYGFDLFKAKQQAAALERFEEALRLARERHDRKAEAYILGMVGLAYAADNQPKETVEWLEKAIPVYREIKDRSGEEVALNSEGAAYVRLKQYAEAMRTFEGSARIAHELKKPADEARALANLAYACLQSNRYQEAIQWYEKAFPIMRELKDRKSEQYSIENAAWAYHKAGDDQSAVRNYQQGLAIVRQLHDRQREAKFLGDIANIFWLAHQYIDANEWYQKALAVQKELKSPRLEAGTLRQLGLVNEWLKRYAEARKWFEQDVEIRRQLKDRLGEARDLYSIGLCCRRSRQYDEALAAFDRCAAAYRELGNRAEEAHVLMGLGDTYGSTYRFAQSDAAYSQSLELYRGLKNRRGEARMLERLGVSQRRQKQSEQAIRSFEQEAHVLHSLKDRAGEARALDDMAKVRDETGETRQAIAYYERELEIWRELKDSANMAVTAKKLGDEHNRLGDLAKSLDYYEQGVTAKQDEKITTKRQVSTVENDFELSDHVEPAVLVLPFVAGKNTRESDREVGVALQLVLENVLMELPEMRQVFLTLNAKKIFKDAGAWKAFQRGERTAARLDGVSCTVTGRVEQEGDRYKLAAAIEREDGSTSEAAIPLDFPSLRQTRISFVRELENAHCGPRSTALEAHLAAQTGPLWSESLEVTAAAALGRARADNLTMLVGGGPGAPDHLEEAVRLAPQSYLAVMNRAYGYQQLGRNAEAAKFYEQAIAKARVLTKSLSEVVLLANACGAYNGASQREKALESCRQAVAQSQAMKNVDGEFLALAASGTAYAAQGQYASAVGSYERALSIGREGRNQAVAGFVRGALANAYYALGRYESAAAYFVQCAEEARAEGNRRTEGQDLASLGQAYAALGQHAKSGRAFEQALTISRELKDRNAESQLLDSLAAEHAALAELETAIREYEQALAMAREVKNRDAEVKALLGLGNCHGALGQHETAIGYLEVLVSLARESKNRGLEGTALLNLSLQHGAMNQVAKALNELERGLEAARESHNQSVEGQILIQLGTLYLRVRQQEKALSYFQNALSAARTARNMPGQALALASLGEAHLAKGRRYDAQTSFNKALHIAIQVKNREMEGRLLTRMGRMYIDSGQKEKGISHFEQARLVARERKDLVGEASAQLSLALAHLFFKEYEGATVEFQRALTVAREAREADLEAQTLAGLMYAWGGRKRPRLAIVMGKESVNILQTTRNELRSVDAAMQQGFAKSREPVYRYLANLLAEQGRLLEAQQVLDMLKQEELSEYVERAKDSSAGQGKATLTGQEAEWEKRYNEIAGRLTESGVRRGALLAKPVRSAGEDEELTKLEADLEIGNRAFQAFLDRMEETFRNDAGEVVRVRDAEAFMETLRELGDGTVAVYTVAGEQGLRSILVTADVQKGYFTPVSAAQLSRKILAFRETLRNPARDPLPLARELYDLLIRPMEKDLEGAGARTIMWSLDGALRYIPIAALHDGRRYMVERYCNVVFTPASQSRLKDAVSHDWRGLGLGVSQAHEGFQALPNVPIELHSIILDHEHQADGVVPGTVKLDADFTKDALRSELHKHYTVVHMASHFDFVPGTYKNSYLLLGDGGKLTLEEFRNMPQVLQGVELLTLSACDTAVGGEGADGKEVEGFAVLAQRQGAKAVIATLWSVPDRSTTMLMQQFYRLRMSGGEMSKAEALREAQVALLTGTSRGDGSGARGVKVPTAPGEFEKDPAHPFAHPHFWAPFLLIGNWK